MKFHPFILPTVAGLALAGATIAIATNQPARETAEPSLPPPESGFVQTVAAVGLVEPASEAIHVGSPRSGIVAEVLVTAGDTVQRGQPLLRLKTDELEHELAVVRAGVRQAAAHAEAAQAQLTASRVRLKVVALELDHARERLAFAANAGDRRIVAGEDLAERQNNVAIQEAKQTSAQAEIRTLDANVVEAGIAVEVARARQTAIENDVARCTLRAPLDGVALQVRIRPGEHLPADNVSLPALVLGELRSLRVRADVDEHEAWKVEATAGAEARVRGLPDHKVRLRFVRFEPLVLPKRSLTGESTERTDTRVLHVIYDVEPTAGIRLFAGQQVDVFIDAASAGKELR
jgi:HlyD family secretion protein